MFFKVVYTSWQLNMVYRKDLKKWPEPKAAVSVQYKITIFGNAFSWFVGCYNFHAFLQYKIKTGERR